MSPVDAIVTKRRLLIPVDPVYPLTKIPLVASDNPVGYLTKVSVISPKSCAFPVDEIVTKSRTFLFGYCPAANIPRVLEAQLAP